MLRYFKSLDMDFRFKSTSELPEEIRKKLLFGSKFENKSSEELALKSEMDVVLTQLIELIETDVDIYVTIPGFLKISLKLHAPLLTNFFKKYLGGLF